MYAVSAWAPSQHTIVVCGLVIGALLVVSAAVTKRDAWLAPLKAHRHAVRRAAIAAAAVVVLAFAAAHVDDLEHLVERVEQGDPAWLALAAGFEALSFGGYVVLTRIVYRPRAPRLDWIPSAELTLAGVVATRVFSAGGAGGIAFTGWVLRRAGMSGRVAARRIAAFMVLLYSLYMGALLLGGLLVLAGVLIGVPHVLGIAATVVGAAVTLLALAILRIPADLERRVEAASHRSGTVGRIASKLAPVPQVAGNAMRLALSLVREAPTVLVWPAVWWAFDVATLWACFHAFGDAPATGTLVLCYFLGQMGNLLPLPGGVGGAEGGMVGAFAASGVDAGLALVAVVSYQVMSTYLPGVPGLGAYLDLRRRMRVWGAADRPAQPTIARA
jgi:uncharacterized membrane protein YbhN (UPF0104 family)